MPKGDGTGPRGQGPGTGKGLGGSGGGQRSGRGPGGNCVCPNCKKTLPHEPGVPCTNLHCPDCNVEMLRE